MKLTRCAVLLCIIVANAQIDDEYEYEIFYPKETQTIRPVNDTKDGELEQLFNNVTSTSEAVVILNGTEERDGDKNEFTSQSLNELREQFVYDFDESHYISEISEPSSMIQMDLGFQMPFFGARYRYANISLDGTVYFSEKPNTGIPFPIKFPLPNWPLKNVPAAIAMLLTKTVIKNLDTNDTDLQKPGVYCRHERYLEQRRDIASIELRERVKWDIRQGMVGADIFDPRHVVIVTWKNVRREEVINDPMYSHQTNSFQMVLATDELQTYTIFNYIHIDWVDKRYGNGTEPSRIPAFVGFNAENGRQFYEYKPFSRAILSISDLAVKGGTNNFLGRHIFRIDEEIVLGSCMSEIALRNISLLFAPQSGNMMGGVRVNITGPCFHSNVPVFCRFDTTIVRARIIDRNRAVCIQPMLYAQGWISFDVAIGAGEYLTHGWYYVETPSTAERTITFPTNQVFDKFDYDKWETIPIRWNPFDISGNRIENITISLWGYTESARMEHIADIDQGHFFGSYEILPLAFNLREALRMHFQFGLLRISISNEIHTPSIWSKPIPLAWYFGRQWERKYGKEWAGSICEQLKEVSYAPFIYRLPACPCTLKEAQNDKGVLLPDPDCSDTFNDRGQGPCIRNPGAAQCLRSSQISTYEQQCCYNSDGDLMSSLDEVGGSRPARSRSFGRKPFTESSNVPSLSTWYADISPYYMCCVYQDERSEGCEAFRTTQRFSSDCKDYNPPKIAAVYGDPHFLTFNQRNYTFNGVGEFVLVRDNWFSLSSDDQGRFEVQGRFEETLQQPQGWSMGTRMTSIVTKENSSAIVEVRQRPNEAQWRYRLDVIVNGRKVYFDSPSRKVQHFDEVTVYTPTDIVDQSHVIIMFSNGNGVEVQEMDGMMAARVYLSFRWTTTTGLLGSSNAVDDFILPSGEVLKIDPMNLREIHENYGMHWRIFNNSESLFFHNTFETASHPNIPFIPIFERDVLATMFNTDSKFVRNANHLCDDNFECLFDFGTTLNASYAKSTLMFQKTTNNIARMFNERPISCGHLPTPKHGRKSNFKTTSGAFVKFICDDGYQLHGDDFKLCMPNGEWSTADTDSTLRKWKITKCVENPYDSHHQYYRDNANVGQIIVVALGILLMMSGVIVCIIWRRRTLQRRNRLQGKHYEQVAEEYLDDDIVEWEVPTKADKQS